MGVAFVGFLLGLPSAVNLDIFGNQDFVWGIALIISGAFVAFAAIRYGVTKFRTEELEGTPGDWSPGRVWDFAIKYLKECHGLRWHEILDRDVPNLTGVRVGFGP